MKTGRLLSFFVACMLLLCSLGVRAQGAVEPTVSQIYAAASSGDLRGAQAMVDQVLARHPDSARAHFVKAELAARGNDMATARSELQAAERLAPGLPFVRPEAAAALRARLDAPAAALPAQRDIQRMGAAPQDPAPQAGGFSLGSLLLPALLVGGIWMFLRRRRAAGPMGAARGPVNDPAFGRGPATDRNGPMVPQQDGHGPHDPYARGPYAGGPQGGRGGGWGGSLARGVGTGLAVGAGAVAAQEIGRRMFDHGDPRPAHDPVAGGAAADSQLARDAGLGAFDPALNEGLDLGGRDFGIVDDAGGWDDGGGFDVGGGDDWNS